MRTMFIWEGTLIYEFTRDWMRPIDWIGRSKLKSSVYMYGVAIL